MFCDRCGKEARAGARFCAACGAEVSVTPGRRGDAQSGVDPSARPAESRPSAQSSHRRKRPILVVGLGVIALLLLLGGYVLYVRAADRAYASALAAHGRGDCAQALRSYN